MVERIELIKRIERIESVESIESIDTFDSIEISSLPHSARSITAASRDGVAPPVLARFCGSCPGTRRHATTIGAGYQQRRYCLLPLPTATAYCHCPPLAFLTPCRLPHQRGPGPAVESAAGSAQKPLAHVVRHAGWPYRPFCSSTGRLPTISGVAAACQSCARRSRRVPARSPRAACVPPLHAYCHCLLPLPPPRRRQPTARAAHPWPAYRRRGRPRGRGRHPRTPGNTRALCPACLPPPERSRAPACREGYRRT